METDAERRAKEDVRKSALIDKMAERIATLSKRLAAATARLDEIGERLPR